MVHYLYRCAERHDTVHDAPIGTSPQQLDCVCGQPATRVLTAPMLATMPPARQQAVESAQASAERPAVVTQPPPPTRPTATTSDPRHARLPRP